MKGATKLKHIQKLIDDYKKETKSNTSNSLSLATNPVSTISNGHVPVGYPTSSISSASPEVKSVVPTGSTSSVATNKKKANNKGNNNNRRKRRNRNRNRNNNKGNKK